MAWLWGPVAALIAAVWFASSTSADGVSLAVWDKAIHAALYALLASLVLRATHGGLNRPWNPRAMALGVSLTLLYGAVDEWHQAHVPGRDPSVADWIADAVGCGLAVGALRWSGRLRARRRTP